MDAVARAEPCVADYASSMDPRLRPLLALLLASFGCSGGQAPPFEAPAGPETGGTATDGSAADGTAGDGTGADGTEVQGIVELSVTATLDGVPTAGIELWQGGVTTRGVTGDDGQATFPVDHDVYGEIVVIATHPEARPALVDLTYGAPPDAVTLALTRFVDVDNPDYTFQHPGEPELRETTAYCAHCHISMSTDWLASAHAGAASDPWLHDLYAGTADVLGDPSDCASAGGTWATGTEPGSGVPVGRCYLGDGVLPALNDCTVGCDSSPAAQPERGQCADCHAPGIDGEAGGRGLLEAQGIAHDYGIHCDVCHKVESVDLHNPDPGTSGKLRLLRPSEDVPVAGLPWTPLTFSPYPDVVNPRMGVVVRDHFQSGEMCGGCHEHWQESLVPGAVVDTERWPEGRFPVHTTWSELETGSLGTDIACVSCHMPGDGDVGNAADLGNLVGWDQQGIAAGWERPPGAVRRHAWFGPKNPEQRMIDLAAALFVDAALEDDALVVSVETRHVGPGHAIPTGEPLRAMLLQVEARCAGERLQAVGGAALPPWAGALAEQDAAEDWSRWPGAQVGDRIVVVQNAGWVDYEGPLQFGDGTFTVAERGLPDWQVQGTAVVTGVSGSLVTLDGPLPSGDRAYRLPPGGLQDESDPAAPLAGTPGFAFARVLADASGDLMVPHFRAVDVVSDNRLMPRGSWTSTHRFTAPCADPVVEARLLYRRVPWALSSEKRWDSRDAVMSQVQVSL